MSSPRKARQCGFDAARLGSDDEWAALRRELRALKGPVRFTVGAYAMDEALEPGGVLAAYAFELLVASARSVVHGGTLECFACRRRWTEARRLAAVGLVELIDIEDTAGLFGLCPDCWDSPNPVALVAEAFRREFCLGGTLTMQTMAPGGRA